MIMKLWILLLIVMATSYAMRPRRPDQQPKNMEYGHSSMSGKNKVNNNTKIQAGTDADATNNFPYHVNTIMGHNVL